MNRITKAQMDRERQEFLNAKARTHGFEMAGHDATPCHLVPVEHIKQAEAWLEGYGNGWQKKKTFSIKPLKDFCSLLASSIGGAK